MAVSVRAGSAVVSNGTASTTTISATPTLPAGTVSGDRVFIVAAAVGTLSAPASWSTALASVSLGTGTNAAGTGPRFTAVYYRDYDGVWSMPSVQAASAASNAIATCAVALTKGVNDSFNAPTSTSGSDTTSGTGFSAAGASTAFATDAVVLLGDTFPGSTTTASGTLTVTSAAFAALSNTVTSGGTALGFNAAVAAWTTTVTTGATAAPTHALTLGTARTGGAAFVIQTVASVVKGESGGMMSAARRRAAFW